MTFRSAAIAGATLCAVAQASQGAATFALLDQIGGTVRMDAGAVDGVFDTDMDVFTDEAMESIQISLTDSGVETAGYVTFVLLETDMGIAFASLVDGVSLVDLRGAVGGGEASVDMTSTGPDHVVGLTNDDGSDLTVPFLLGGRMTVGGAFAWNDDPGDSADAFAWAGFMAGDVVSFTFTENDNTIGGDGLTDIDTFRFASWNDQSESWEIVATSEFTVNDQFGFTAEIVPAPGSTAILFTGAVALVGRRRRG